MVPNFEYANDTIPFTERNCNKRRFGFDGNTDGLNISVYLSSYIPDTNKTAIYLNSTMIEERSNLNISDLLSYISGWVNDKIAGFLGLHFL